MVVGIGGIVGALLRLRSLHDLKEPPYALFAFFLAACAVWVLGALIHPVIYRCPSCHRRVAVPDPTESGTILLEDPDQCPHCHARLRG
jgi:DNA-directed RNA polymerase subunit RPC12/RpoP